MTEQQQQQQISPPSSSTEESTVSSMTLEELKKECSSLRKQNSLLNGRLLGVNELARLLQEKSDLVESLNDKNKRLELAVVRLENRSSNLEKKLKGSQFSSLPSSVNAPRSQAQQVQQHGSPFIPGPSKQILETLMKENTDLKKTLDNMTKKGPTSYREAVKVNQLEEVIDQKNEKIELLRDQLDSLTASQKEGVEGAGDATTLKRQLLKMEQSMKVKDRFCSLLSERVNQLQKEVHEARKGVDEFDGLDSGVGQFQSSKMDASLESLSREHEIKERNLRKMIDELQGQVERERNEKRDAITQADESRQKMIDKQSELDLLQSKFDDSNLYTETLLSEKMTLTKQLESARKSSNPSEFRDVSYYIGQMENKDAQIDRLKQMLEDAQYKYALAESKRENFGQIGELEERVKDLEEEKLGLEDEIANHKRTIQDLNMQNRKLKSGSSYVPTAIRTGGAPPLHLRSYHGEDVFADGKNFHDIPMRPEVPPINLASRNVDTDGTTTESTSTSVATPTYTTSESDMVRPSLPLSTSASRMTYRPSVPVTPVNPQVYSNPGYMMTHHPAPSNYTDLSQRHGYQPTDAHSYQTHSMVSGGGGGGGVQPMGGAGSGYPRGGLPRSLSSSPGPSYTSSSIPFSVSTGSLPPQPIMTQSSAIFGQHAPSYFTSTPTGAYSSQYPGPPGQRYDLSQYYPPGNFFTSGGYHGMPPSSSQSSNVGGGQGPGGQGGAGPAPPPPPTGQGHMRRHSPPDPRYGNQPQ